MRKSSRVTIGLSLVGAIILVAGGAAIASNAGFKMNKPLVPAGAGLVGSNWTSIPYFSPYGAILIPAGPNAGKPSVQGVCDGLGMTVGSGSITTLNEVSGTFSAGICGAVGTGAGGTANQVELRAGKGLQIRDPNLTNAIIVGSHDPSLSLTIPAAGSGAVGSFWLSVPYHSTWTNLQDVCTSVGLTPNVAVVQRLNNSGAFGTPWLCTGAPGSEALVLGEHIQIRNDVQVSFVPAHF